MTEREMLELAAKAAGLTVLGYRENYNEYYWYGPESGLEIDGENGVWNPLADDGDALRLAVKLHMTVRCYMGNACAQIGVPGQPNVYVDETNCEDPRAATRLAITRAAASIGKAMS